jgi:hypothetical protein
MTDNSTQRRICAGCRHPDRLHAGKTGACLAKSCRQGPDGTPCPGFADANPPGQEQQPWFSTNTVATVFFGRSAAWLRKCMRGQGFPEISRTAAGDRQFSLDDIAKAAYTLRLSGGIDDEQLADAIQMTEACARQYARRSPRRPRRTAA